jgi:hemolysin D
VQQLQIHTIGGVVTPAQELMLIVPDEESLEVEALLENKDIGFVEEGQQAEVKIDAFPFTKYGTIDGTLTDISNDAVVDEAKGLVFKTQVALNRSVMRIGKRQVKLTPGMSVVVEVKTGTRRVIEFFLAPLLRYKQESIRER